MFSQRGRWYAKNASKPGHDTTCHDARTHASPTKEKSKIATFHHFLHIKSFVGPLGKGVKRVGKKWPKMIIPSADQIFPVAAAKKIGQNKRSLAVGLLLSQEKKNKRSLSSSSLSSIFWGGGGRK